METQEASSGTVAVSFEPEGRTLEIPRGVTLREAAGLAGLSIASPCGGQGNCGKCRVRVSGVQPTVTASERVLLSEDQLRQGHRLACQARVAGPATIQMPKPPDPGEIPILVEAKLAAFIPENPMVRLHPVKLAPATLEAGLSDHARLEQSVGPVQMELGMMRELPGKLRDVGDSGTAVVVRGWLLDYRQGAGARRGLAAAFDIGTTTLAATLFDAETGEELAAVSRLNPQTDLADDVLSRISYTITHPDGLHQLQAKLLLAVNEMLRTLASGAGVSVHDVCAVTFAGNTTMQHLLLGLDPASIGVSPFTPVTHTAVELSASELDLDINPRARCLVLPVIAGYLGGDTVAGLVATRFAELEGPALFIDIGTNGEMVVNAHGRLVAASCAAGPAFEGACITHGMRAAPGAIEAVRLEEGVALKIIGGRTPAGICGSALIDLLAELLRLRIVETTGLMRSSEDAPAGLNTALSQRLWRNAEESGFTLVKSGDTSTGQPIHLLQQDVRQLQLAIAAVRSGLLLLLRRLDLKPADLQAVLVAGAFGNYMRCENAQRIGLLPPEVAPSKMVFVGNTSLAGARQIALSARARETAGALAERTEHVEFSRDPGFEEVFMHSLMFPAAKQAAG